MHVDDDYAAGTRFGRRVAHGTPAASLISATLANELPGPGTVNLSQSLRFVAPVFPAATVHDAPARACAAWASASTSSPST